MRRQQRGLIVLNGALLAALGAVCLTPGAGADQGAAPPAAGAGARSRGTYTLLSPRIAGVQEGSLFIIDAANRELAVVRWDGSRRELITVGHRDMSADAAASTGTRTR